MTKSLFLSAEPIHGTSFGCSLFYSTEPCTSQSWTVCCKPTASGSGGEGAVVRPPSDTVNTGGGAVKIQSCKSQAQNLQDKKFGSESIRPRLKGPGSSLLQQKTHRGIKYTNPTAQI